MEECALKIASGGKSIEVRESHFDRHLSSYKKKKFRILMISAH